MGQQEEPKSQGPAIAGATDPGTLGRISDLEYEVGHLKRAVKFIQDTNSLIVIVLFVAVLGLLFVVAFAGINALNSDNNSRTALTQSVQQLTKQVQALKTK